MLTAILALALAGHGSLRTGPTIWPRPLSEFVAATDAAKAAGAQELPPGTGIQPGWQWAGADHRPDLYHHRGPVLHVAPDGVQTGTSAAPIGAIDDGPRPIDSAGTRVMGQHHRSDWCATCARDKAGRIARSGAAKRAFLRSLGLKRTPPGMVIDHVRALAAGGSDTPDNMQLETVADAKAKDRIER